MTGESLSSRSRSSRDLCSDAVAGAAADPDPECCCASLLWIRVSRLHVSVETGIMFGRCDFGDVFVSAGCDQDAVAG
ncbi:hypothetical protein AKJ16_DCAP18364 [Drosera capensis]